MGDRTYSRQSTSVPIDGLGSIDFFHAFLDGQILGPFSTEDLRKLPGFMLQTPVRPVGSEEWSPAFTLINLKSYLDAPLQKPPMPAFTGLVNEPYYGPTATTTPSRSPRWIKRFFSIVMLIGLGWMAVQTSRLDWRSELTNRPLAMQGYLKRQGHRVVTHLIDTLHDIDFVWFSEEPPNPRHPRID
jgi:hypothetical protein